MSRFNVRDEEILSLFRQGVSCREIAERLDVVLRVVLTAIDNAGLKPRLNGEAAIAADVLSRLCASTDEIAKALKVSEAAVHNSRAYATDANVVPLRRKVAS